MEGENRRQRTEPQVVKLDDRMRMEIFKQSIYELYRVEAFKQQAGCYVPQVCETRKEMEAEGAKIGNLALDHVRGPFPTETIALTCEFDEEQAPDEDFNLLCTVRLVCQRGRQIPEIEGAWVSVALRREGGRSGTVLARELLNADEHPFRGASRMVADGFAEVFPAFTLVSELEDEVDERQKIRSVTFVFVRTDLVLNKRPHKR